MEQEKTLEERFEEDLELFRERFEKPVEFSYEAKKNSNGLKYILSLGDQDSGNGTPVKETEAYKQLSSIAAQRYDAILEKLRTTTEEGAPYRDDDGKLAVREGVECVDVWTGRIYESEALIEQLRNGLSIESEFAEAVGREKADVKEVAMQYLESTMDVLRKATPEERKELKSRQNDLVLLYNTLGGCLDLAGVSRAELNNACLEAYALFE